MKMQRYEEYSGVHVTISMNDLYWALGTTGKYNSRGRESTGKYEYPKRAREYRGTRYKQGTGIFYQGYFEEVSSTGVFFQGRNVLNFAWGVA
ncbi:hypothetical protein T06_8857 [Trichinella sp. T6]|nr:hypothetical protein T06_11087 [Trichinella sp. T6]KRX81288.1 hypothetical protein T06_7131 [Trichinella sp. T6]KRX81350.1 hypothetical protein T06_8857 [Trichinella sp. T6]